MKKVDYSKELLEENIKDCYSISELCRRLGLTPRGSNFKTVRQKLDMFNVDYSHFTGMVWNKDPNNPIYKNKLIPKLCEHSSLRTDAAKKILYKLGLKENKCEKCGINEWNGKEIICEIHHINGDQTDNRIENLIILCPNCHSQTHNYRNRKSHNDNHTKTKKSKAYTKMLEEYEKELAIKKDAKILSKRKRISINDAIDMIKNSPNQSINDFPIVTKNKLKKICESCGTEFKARNNKQKFCSYECLFKEQSKNIPPKDILINDLFIFNVNLTQIGKKYNVSSTSVVKWCKKYNLPYKVKELRDLLENRKFEI